MAMQPKTVTHQASASYALLPAIVASIGGFLFGYDTAAINGTVVALGKAFGANSVTTGLAVSAALLGSAVGAFGAGQLADRYGRVKTMFLAAVFFIICGFASGFASGIPAFMIWRLTSGIVIGVASVIAPAYIAEISPAPLRGRLRSGSSFRSGTDCYPIKCTEVGVEPRYAKISARVGWKPDSVVENQRCFPCLRLDPKARCRKTCGVVLHFLGLMSVQPPLDSFRVYIYIYM